MVKWNVKRNAHVSRRSPRFRTTTVKCQAFLCRIYSYLSICKKRVGITVVRGASHEICVASAADNSPSLDFTYSSYEASYHHSACTPPLRCADCALRYAFLEQLCLQIRAGCSQSNVDAYQSVKVPVYSAAHRDNNANLDPWEASQLYCIKPEDIRGRALRHIQLDPD